MSNEKCLCASATARFIETINLASKYVGEKQKITDKKIFSRLNQALNESINKLESGCKVDLSSPRESLKKADKIIEDAGETIDVFDRNDIDDSYYEVEKGVWDVTHGSTTPP